MKSRIRKIVAGFVSNGSLRRRVAFSLAIVRLILVPVFLVAAYYLFAMGWIVDRIVNIDAPAAALAQQASIQMLDARRAERNYFLLRDPYYVRFQPGLYNSRKRCSDSYSQPRTPGRRR